MTQLIINLRAHILNSDFLFQQGIDVIGTLVATAYVRLWLKSCNITQSPFKGKKQLE